MKALISHDEVNIVFIIFNNMTEYNAFEVYCNVIHAKGIEGLNQEMHIFDQRASFFVFFFFFKTEMLYITSIPM